MVLKDKGRRYIRASQYKDNKCRESGSETFKDLLSLSQTVLTISATRADRFEDMFHVSAVMTICKCHMEYYKPLVVAFAD